MDVSELYSGLPSEQIFRICRTRQSRVVLDPKACRKAAAEAREKGPAVEQQVVEMLIKLADDENDRVAISAMRVLKALTRALIARNQIRKLYDDVGA